MKLIVSDYLFDKEKLYNDRAVVMHKNNVVDVATFRTLKKCYPEARIEEYYGGVLFPGFINAHTHIELSNIKGKTKEGEDFVAWLKSIMKNKTATASGDQIKKAIFELKKSGVGAVGDISNTLKTAFYLKKYMPESVLFWENYSLLEDKAKQKIEKIKKSLFLLGVKKPKLRLSLHAVYSTHPCLAEFICNHYKAPLSIHFLESKYEEMFLKGQGRLFDFLQEAGFIENTSIYSHIWDFLKTTKCLKPKTIFVHCVLCKKRDLERIKLLDGSVCLCLRSNEFISKQLPDVYAILESGINVAIGTDSLASNKNLNFLEELSFIYERFPLLDPEVIFKWAIDGGAKALQLYWGFVKRAKAYPVFIPSTVYHPLRSILEKEEGRAPLLVNA